VKGYNDQYDTAVLVSGDGDFAGLLQAVKDLGKHVEVVSFPHGSAQILQRVCDDLIVLNDAFLAESWLE